MSRPLTGGLFPSDFSTKMLYEFLMIPMRAKCSTHLVFLDLVIIIIGYTWWRMRRAFVKLTWASRLKCKQATTGPIPILFHSQQSILAFKAVYVLQLWKRRNVKQEVNLILAFSVRRVLFVYLLFVSLSSAVIKSFVNTE
jgi:hypothetical protein